MRKIFAAAALALAGTAGLAAQVVVGGTGNQVVKQMLPGMLGGATNQPSPCPAAPASSWGA